MSEENTVANIAPIAPPAPAAAPASDGQQPVQNTTEQAPVAPAGEKPALTPEQAEKRGTSRFERRLGNAYRRAAEEKARADLLERQLTEARAPKAEAPTGAPRLEEFGYDAEAYAKAYGKFEAERALQEHQEKQRTESQKQYQQRLVSEWNIKAERADDKYDDFDEVVGDLKPTAPWSVAIMESDNAEDVAYYLAKHLDEATRIASLSPTGQIRAIGRLEAKLLAEPPKKPEPSKAPAPIAPVTGVKPASNELPSEEDDMRTWIRKRNKQVHGT